ncbi:MAG: sialate O-acetylesterase [bacterium]
MNVIWKSFRPVLYSILVLGVTSSAQVKLPRLISDGMVVQRNTNVKIWGWASSNETVAIRFVDSTYHSVADSTGTWSVALAPLNAGGPYTMEISASNRITIKDILIGDVWVCSGQSNMELNMNRARLLYETEIATANNSFIRHFTVPQKYNFQTPQEDLQSGTWISTTPETILNFSAVAYFFTKELYERYQVPIGLINASLGGSPAEAWLSEEALKQFPAHFQEAQRFKDNTLIAKIESDDNTRIQAWYTLLRKKDFGHKNPKQSWYSPSLNTNAWATMIVPGYWAETSLGEKHGAVWFRRSFTIPSSIIGKPARLNLGRIVDADSVFINGIFIGTTSYQYPPRRYMIPANVLKKGKNTIVVRVINNSGKGGFIADKSYEIVSGDIVVDLKGKWQYRLGAEMEPLASQTFIRWKPLGLYNAMIAPLLNYRINGVIWYQGESNATRALEYGTLFPALMSDWRARWQQGNFSFLFVQLPNFMEAKSEPSEGGWALFRESQCMALSEPNTAMAVTIDIGEWNDIHPLNKKEVGRRLALAAQHVAYGARDVVFSGPLYQSMKAEGNKIILSFNHIGSGLIARGDGKLHSFAIAGADKRFVWAHATIEGNTVIVWHDSIPSPVAVRYAWADNPAGANLYNKEGLPASPFRTDTWNLK